MREWSALPRYRERIAIAICCATSGGQGPPGVHECDCKDSGKTECPDTLAAADGAIFVMMGGTIPIPEEADAQAGKDK